MEEETEIDCEYTDEVTCPCCGYEEADSWERCLGDGDSVVVTCGNCGRTFDVVASVTVTYSSFPVSEKTLKLRDVRRKLSVARFIERITRKELFRLGVHADLVRANKLTCELEAEMARLSA